MTDPEQFSTFNDRAIQHHEMYTAWVAAGFTHEQAMELLCCFIAELVRGSIDGC